MIVAIWVVMPSSTSLCLATVLLFDSVAVPSWQVLLSRGQRDTHRKCVWQRVGVLPGR
jgi:hypothetical protein